jgi:uncharacterized protein (DUF433 family)
LLTGQITGSIASIDKASSVEKLKGSIMSYPNYSDGRITIDPAICNGKPTLRGKRIAVQTILGYLSEGDSADEILAQYPSLEADDIRACLRFATAVMSQRYDLAKVA